MSVKKTLCLYLLLPTILVWGSCSDKIEPGNQEAGKAGVVRAAVAVAKVKIEPFIYEAVGTVTARTASTLSSEMMGIVKAVRVNEGDFVKKGDLLIEIDEQKVSAAVQQAEAALAEAKRAEASARSARDVTLANARLAQVTYDRYLQLKKEDSTSQQEFDEVAARYQQAKASLAQAEAMLEAGGYRVQQAEAALNSSRIRKKDAKILSPYDGKVTAKMINIGDMASPGTPFLTLEKEGAHCADFVLPERHINSVQLDKKVKVVIPALNDKVLEGTVGRIVPTADNKTRSFQIKVALPVEKSIRSGMFARVAIPVGEAGILLIPPSAIVRQGQLTGIYIVDDQQKARFRLVRPGRTVGDALEIISGLKEGDRYVVSPPPKITDGVTLEVSS